MLAQHQRQQPDYLGGDNGNDERSNHEIERDIHQLQREMHAVLVNAIDHYRKLHAMAMYDIQVIELREARSREQFDWPTPPPARPAPFSMPLAPRPVVRPHVDGRMRHPLIVEAEERRNHG